jgi:beta-xylosidase
MIRLRLLVFCLIATTCIGWSQDNSGPLSKVWVADLGNGSYRNPVLHADYSDPDVCRVGDDFYMAASSFNAVPGLPILHSKDLVNWTLIGHALQRQRPFEYYDKPRHGGGVWAPAIRYHDDQFYIYYPDPDFGIYVTKATNPAGPWSDPVLVEGGRGLIDPCPLWDDDGSVYLVHAYAGSRAGIKSILVIKRMNADGTKVIDKGVLVYDGHQLDPTVEGPKLYKRNGYYYIFAPAGGVATGWQLVLRSKNIYGPYERRIVMAQGKTSINGPHQGAWVDTKSGSHWFLHFQDKGAYGRVVHLQPMKWVGDWPIIGRDEDGDGTGEPYLEFTKPVSAGTGIRTPFESDEFTNGAGLQWQWPANPGATWSFATNTGSLRLYCTIADSASNFWDLPNMLLQKFPAPEFKATTKIVFKPLADGEVTGLIVMGLSYAWIGLEREGSTTYLVVATCTDADKGNPEKRVRIRAISQSEVYLRVDVNASGECSFHHSVDGKKFEATGTPFTARPGKWIGAKVGMFCSGIKKTNDSGFAELDWFRIEK